MVLADFLGLTSSNISAGMPIDRALWFAVRPKFGILAREIEEVATMESLLTHTENEKDGTIVPVWLKTKLTEIGTLELWCVARDDESRQWKLEFGLRKENENED